MAEFLGFVIAEIGKKIPVRASAMGHCLSQSDQGRKQCFSQAVNKVMRSWLMKTDSSVTDSDYSISLLYCV